MAGVSGSVRPQHGGDLLLYWISRSWETPQRYPALRKPEVNACTSTRLAPLPRHRCQSVHQKHRLAAFHLALEAKTAVEVGGIFRVGIFSGQFADGFRRNSGDFRSPLGDFRDTGHGFVGILGEISTLRIPAGVGVQSRRNQAIIASHHVGAERAAGRNMILGIIVKTVYKSLDVGWIQEVFFDHHMDHRQHHGGIGSGFDRYPPVGIGGTGVILVGADIYNSCTRFPCLDQVPGGVGAHDRFGKIAAPEDDQLRVDERIGGGKKQRTSHNKGGHMAMLMGAVTAPPTQITAKMV